MQPPAEHPEQLSLWNRLFALLQSVLPHHLLSAMMHRVARSEWRPLKETIIKGVISHFDIDLSQAAIKDPDAYPSFNAFFTRELEPGARPVADGEGDIVSPVDGTVNRAGKIDGHQLIQAKGHYYSLEALLGGDDELVRLFAGGSFSTIYLSPRDYHRIHMPLDGKLQKMAHIPGRLFSVNDATTKAIPGLFARNERVVTLFDTPAGPMALIMVGAIFVGSMDTVWSGTVTPVSQRVSAWDYGGRQTAEVFLRKGEEMGRFNMGSTVILLFPENSVALDEALTPGTGVQMGERIGGILHSA